MIFEEVPGDKIYHKNIENNNDQNINNLTHNKFIRDKNEPYFKNTYNDIKRKQEYKNRNIK